MHSKKPGTSLRQILNVTESIREQLRFRGIELDTLQQELLRDDILDSLKHMKMVAPFTPSNFQTNDGSPREVLEKDFIYYGHPEEKPFEVLTQFDFEEACTRIVLDEDSINSIPVLEDAIYYQPRGVLAEIDLLTGAVAVTIIPFNTPSPLPNLCLIKEMDGAGKGENIKRMEGCIPHQAIGRFLYVVGISILYFDEDKTRMPVEFFNFYTSAYQHETCQHVYGSN